MRRGGLAAAPRLARCERAAASRPYWILISFYCPKWDLCKWITMQPGTRPGVPDPGGNHAFAAILAAFPGVKNHACIVM